MSAEASRCPKCNGEMAQGFIFEYDGAMRWVSAWVEGAPKKSWFFGSAKVPKEKCVPVGTFRYSAFGFLESYARPEFGAK